MNLPVSKRIAVVIVVVGVIAIGVVALAVADDLHLIGHAVPFHIVHYLRQLF